MSGQTKLLDYLFEQHIKNNIKHNDISSKDVRKTRIAITLLALCNKEIEKNKGLTTIAQQIKRFVSSVIVKIRVALKMKPGKSTEQPTELQDESTGKVHELNEHLYDLRYGENGLYDKVAPLPKDSANYNLVNYLEKIAKDLMAKEAFKTEITNQKDNPLKTFIDNIINERDVEFDTVNHEQVSKNRLKNSLYKNDKIIINKTETQNTHTNSINDASFEYVKNVKLTTNNRDAALKNTIEWYQMHYSSLSHNLCRHSRFFAWMWFNNPLVDKTKHIDLQLYFLLDTYVGLFSYGNASKTAEDKINGLQQLLDAHQESQKLKNTTTCYAEDFYNILCKELAAKAHLVFDTKKHSKAYVQRMLAQLMAYANQQGFKHALGVVVADDQDNVYNTPHFFTQTLAKHALKFDFAPRLDTTVFKYNYYRILIGFMIAISVLSAICVAAGAGLIAFPMVKGLPFLVGLPKSVVLTIAIISSIGATITNFLLFIAPMNEVLTKLADRFFYMLNFSNKIEGTFADFIDFNKLPVWHSVLLLILSGIVMAAASAAALCIGTLTTVSFFQIVTFTSSLGAAMAAMAAMSVAAKTALLIAGFFVGATMWFGIFALFTSVSINGVIRNLYNIKDTLHRLFIKDWKNLSTDKLGIFAKLWLYSKTFLRTWALHLAAIIVGVSTGLWATISSFGVFVFAIKGVIITVTGASAAIAMPISIVITALASCSFMLFNYSSMYALTKELITSLAYMRYVIGFIRDAYNSAPPKEDKAFYPHIAATLAIAVLATPFMFILVCINTFANLGYAADGLVALNVLKYFPKWMGYIITGLTYAGTGGNSQQANSSAAYGTGTKFDELLHNLDTEISDLYKKVEEQRQDTETKNNNNENLNKEERKQGKKSVKKN